MHKKHTLNLVTIHIEITMFRVYNILTRSNKPIQKSIKPINQKRKAGKQYDKIRRIRKGFRNHL